MFFGNTINTDRYHDVILYAFVVQISEDEISLACFQQDSAVARRILVSMGLLLEVFGDSDFQQYLATEAKRFYTP
jgi:hypothetical protein